MASIVTAGAAGKYSSESIWLDLVSVPDLDIHVQSHELHTFPAMLLCLFSRLWRLIQTFRATFVPWPTAKLPASSPKAAQRSYLSDKMPTLYSPFFSPSDLARLPLSQCHPQFSSMPFPTSTNSHSTLSFFTSRSSPFHIPITRPLPPSDRPALPSWSRI